MLASYISQYLHYTHTPASIDILTQLFSLPNISETKSRAIHKMQLRKEVQIGYCPSSLFVFVPEKSGTTKYINEWPFICLNCSYKEIEDEHRPVRVHRYYTLNNEMEKG